MDAENPGRRLCQVTRCLQGSDPATRDVAVRAMNFLLNVTSRKQEVVFEDGWIYLRRKAAHRPIVHPAAVVDPIVERNERIARDNEARTLRANKRVSAREILHQVPGDPVVESSIAIPTNMGPPPGFEDAANLGPPPGFEGPPNQGIREESGVRSLLEEPTPNDRDLGTPPGPSNRRIQEESILPKDTNLGDAANFGYVANYGGFDFDADLRGASSPEGSIGNDTTLDPPTGNDTTLDSLTGNDTTLDSPTGNDTTLDPPTGNNPNLDPPSFESAAGFGGAAPDSSFLHVVQENWKRELKRIEVKITSLKVQIDKEKLVNYRERFVNLIAANTMLNVFLDHLPSPEFPVEKVTVEKSYYTKLQGKLKSKKKGPDFDVILGRIRNGSLMADLDLEEFSLEGSSVYKIVDRNEIGDRNDVPLGGGSTLEIIFRGLTYLRYSLKKVQSIEELLMKEEIRILPAAGPSPRDRGRLKLQAKGSVEGINQDAVVGYGGILTNEEGNRVKEYFGRLRFMASPLEADFWPVYIGLNITLKQGVFHQIEIETESDNVVKLIEDEHYEETIQHIDDQQCDKDCIKYLVGQCARLIKGYGVQLIHVDAEVDYVSALAQTGTTQDEDLVIREPEDSNSAFL